MSFFMKTRIECGEEFYDAPNRRGFVNKCDECSKPKPTEEQQKKWEAVGNHFINSEGEEVHFEVLHRFSVNEPIGSKR